MFFHWPFVNSFLCSKCNFKAFHGDCVFSLYPNKKESKILTYMYLSIYLSVYLSISIYTYICIFGIYIYIYTCIYIIYINIYAIYILYIYICMCIHIHIYKFIQTSNYDTEWWTTVSPSRHKALGLSHSRIKWCATFMQI